MIRVVSFSLLFLLICSSYAQSNLPACQGSDVSKWTNCFGTETFTESSKYVGDFKNGKSNGIQIQGLIKGVGPLKEVDFRSN